MCVFEWVCFFMPRCVCLCVCVHVHVCLFYAESMSLCVCKCLRVYLLRLCVCVCVCACMCVCARVRAWICVRVWVSLTLCRPAESLPARLSAPPRRTPGPDRFHCGTAAERSHLAGDETRERISNSVAAFNPPISTMVVYLGVGHVTWVNSSSHNV